MAKGISEGKWRIPSFPLNIMHPSHFVTSSYRVLIEYLSLSVGPPDLPRLGKPSLPKVDLRTPLMICPMLITPGPLVVLKKVTIRIILEPLEAKERAATNTTIAFCDDNLVVLMEALESRKFQNNTIWILRISWRLTNPNPPGSSRALSDC